MATTLSFSSFLNFFFLKKKHPVTIINWKLTKPLLRDFFFMQSLKVKIIHFRFLFFFQLIYRQFLQIRIENSTTLSVIFLTCVKFVNIFADRLQKTLKIPNTSLLLRKTAKKYVDKHWEFEKKNFRDFTFLE